MEKRFINSMTQPQRLWLAYAIIGVAIADNTLEEGEFEYLQQVGELAPTLTEGKENSVLYQIISKKQHLKLDPLPVEDPKLARKMFIVLMKEAASDGDIAPAEVDYLRDVAANLSLSREFFEESLEWARAYSLLNKQAQKMIELG